MKKPKSISHGKTSESENYLPMKGDKEFKVGNTHTKSAKGNKTKNMCMGGRVK